MRRVAGGALALVVLATMLVIAQVSFEVAVSPTPASAASTSTPLTVSSRRGLAVDPGSGRVFVSGDNAIDVFAPDGARVATVAGVPGAGGIDIAAGSLWATMSANTLVEIDLDTLAIVRSVPLPFRLESELVVVGTQAFVGVDNPFLPGSDMGLAVDLVTGATQGIPGSYIVDFHRAADVTDRVFMVTKLFNEPSIVKAISTTPPYPLLSEWTTAGLDAAEVSSDGRVLWGVSDVGASTTEMRELDLATGQMTPVGTYQATSNIRSIAHTSARGGLIAATSMTEASFNQVGASRGVGKVAISTDLFPPPLTAFSPDGFVLWRATTFALERITFVPSISSIAPNTVPAARGTRVELKGSMLSGASSVTVGGTPATIVDAYPLWIAFTVPTSLPRGTYEVLVEHPLGNVSTTLTVTDPVGSLAGRVRIGNAGRSGVTVQASGGGLPGALTTTTRGDGGFTFTDVPAIDDTYRLEVVQPPIAGSGVVVEHVVVLPNSTTNIPIDLRTATIAPAASTTTKLPGTSSDPFGPFLTDPASGTTFVQKGTELLAIDRDGDLVGRVRGFAAPQGIAVGDGSVFVAAAATSGPGSRVARVDATTFAVTGQWTVPAMGNGAIAFAGGQLFVLTDASGGEVQALDLTSGALLPAGTPPGATRLAAVAGAADQLLVSTATELALLDVSGPTPVTLAELDGPGPAVAADGPSDLLWTDGGLEYQLSSLTPTGRDFGVDGDPTASPAHGGIVAFGPNVVSIATSSLAHTLASSPRSGLASTGDVAFAPSTTGDLTVFDLKPIVTGSSASPRFVDGTFTVTGRGLRSTTAAEVDGVAVEFEVRSATQVEIHTPGSSGSHDLTLTTPWGTTAPLAFVADARPAPSTVTGVVPATVPIPGGPVTITGTDFTWATRIDVGGVPVTTFTKVDDTTIQFVAPPHPAGAAPIRVDNLLHTGVPGGPLTYVYAGVAPTVTSLSPTGGTTFGGTSVQITGAELGSAVFVTFDGVPATNVTVFSSTRIGVTSPPHPAGPVEVRVTTAGGMSPAVPAATFTYRIPPPVTTGLSPATGYTVGGTSVTITGTSFAGATSVKFGAIPATSFTVVDDHTIVAVAPPRSTAGAVNVLVTTPAGTDQSRTTNRFSYTVQPTGSIGGVIRGPDGPLGSMVVMVSPAASQSVVATVASGVDGSFSVPSLPVGSYKLNVFDGRLIFGQPARFAGGWYVAGGTITASFSGSTAVPVSAGATATIDPIVLVGTPGSISGVVTDGSSPLASMVVLISPASGLEPVTYAVTGSDGTFSIGGLAAGEYKVIVVDGAAFFGLPLRYRPEYYDDLPYSPEVFADAATVLVSAGGGTLLPTIAVDPV